MQSVFASGLKTTTVLAHKPETVTSSIKKPANAGFFIESLHLSFFVPECMRNGLRGCL